MHQPCEGKSAAGGLGGSRQEATPNPSSLGQNSFYSKHWFSLCPRHFPTNSCTRLNLLRAMALGFLNIPGELRNIIYENILISALPIEICICKGYLRRSRPPVGNRCRYSYRPTKDPNEQQLNCPHAAPGLDSGPHAPDIQKNPAPSSFIPQEMATAMLGMICEHCTGLDTLEMVVGTLSEDYFGYVVCAGSGDHVFGSAVPIPDPLGRPFYLQPL